MRVYLHTYTLNGKTTDLFFPHNAPIDPSIPIVVTPIDVIVTREEKVDGYTIYYFNYKGGEYSVTLYS